MECKEARELLTALYDGDLNSLKEGDLLEHLDSCDSCRAHWETYRAAVEEVSGLANLELFDDHDDFAGKVQKTIKHRSRGRFFDEKREFSVLFALVSFVLIIAVMFLYLWAVHGMGIVLID